MRTGAADVLCCPCRSGRLRLVARMTEPKGILGAPAPHTRRPGTHILRGGWPSSDGARPSERSRVISAVRAGAQSLLVGWRDMRSTPVTRPLGAFEAFRRLRDGNRRFVQNVRSVDSLLSQSARRSLVDAQAPIAVVLSCSDSRAPAELVFDQGLGDLFVVRVAGNVIAPSLVGSVEFAAASFGTELIVVMGHTHCGVIAATVDGLVAGKAFSDNIRDIVERVRPAIEHVVRRGSSIPDPVERASLLAAATRANVRASTDHLRHESKLLADLAHDGRLVVVGAEYSLETGAVDFFDGALE